MPVSLGQTDVLFAFELDYRNPRPVVMSRA